MAQRNRLAELSFMTFAMFFGAGNLIFPAFLADQAGEHIIPAFIGFAVTAIGCPVLALIAIEKSGSVERLASRVHPLFSRIFTIVIYLAIGPCLAIPRTASTSYAMIEEAFSFQSTIVCILYSVLFFAASSLIAMHPEKLRKSLGRVLSPLLILLIAVLFIGTVTIKPSYGTVAEAYADTPFATGFREGYQTMDAIAGLVFGSVLMLTVKASGKSPKDSVKAALGGGILLLLIYTALASVGCRAEAFIANPPTGAEILSAASGYISPSLGRILIASIFIIACFNTCVSLLSSCGEYFSSLCPKLDRKRWIILFAVISGIIANAGLERIIALSSPVLEFIYPAAICIILLSFIPGSERRLWTMRACVIAVLLSSLLSLLSVPMPLQNAGFGWLLPAAAGTVIGLIADRVGGI